MKKIKFPTSDKSLSIVAFLISIATFLMFSYQTRLMKKQAYASVLPYLEIWYNRPDSLHFNFMLVNSGIGPAFIQDYHIEYKDSTYQMDPGTFLNNVLHMADSLDYSFSNLRKGRLIPAGQEVYLVSTAGSQKSTKYLEELFGSEQVKLVIRFSSVYEEAWRVEGMLSQPVRTD